MDKQNLIKLIKKRWKEHKEDADPDGLAMCPIEEHNQYRYDEKVWRGTKEDFIKFKQQHESLIGKIHCEMCSLCEELLKKLHSDN